MLVPGADDVHTIAIALPRTNKRIGRGQNPLVLDGNPIVVFAEQGIIGANLGDEILAPVGVPALEAGGNESINLVSAAESIFRASEDKKPREIGHVVIALDVSSSMKEASGALKLDKSPENTTKLQHVQLAIQTLIENGIPENTPVTLIVYSDNAQIPNDKQVPSKPLEFRTDLKTLFQIFAEIKIQNMTNAHSGLLLASNKITEHNTGNRSPENTLLIFITDGNINVGPGNTQEEKEEEIYKLARQLRLQNVHSCVIGVGPGYNDNFLRRLTSELGPAMMVHTPHPNPEINVFDMFIPEFARDIRNEHYMSIIGRGFTPNAFFDLVPTIKVAQYRELPSHRLKHLNHHSLWGGYQSQIIGLGITPKSDKARLHLSLSELASSQKPSHTTDIPIIAIGDADSYGYHEYKEKAETAYARLIAFLSQREFDADNFDAIVREFPQSFNPDEAASISQTLRGPVSDQNQLRGSVSDASMGVSIRTVGSYSGSIRVNDFSQIPGKRSVPKPLQSGSPIDKPPQIDDESSPVVSDSGKQSNLHSGHLGPLSAPAVGTGYGSIIDPLAYNQAKPITPNLSLEFNPPDAVIISDPQVFTKDKINIGRLPTCDIVIDRKKVSRLHCQILRKEGKLFIQDSASTNGTYLNGVRVFSSELRNEDLVNISDVEIKVKVV